MSRPQKALFNPSFQGRLSTLPRFIIINVASNFREPRILHEQLYGEDKSEWRGPTFCDNNIHEARVTGIKSLAESLGEEDGLAGGAKDRLSAFRVVSVDYSGAFIDLDWNLRYIYLFPIIHCKILSLLI